ncbi:hypothetical protein PHMEG_00034234 [Phytophthora megakarya]|uniref:Tc1-like transposase DDE domain-containing protein n=1 Tax=Phytophthora megakarya TaxID=4795 RepID=A0A225URG6_9STRA|nr:hypothetical protein PHMEG_00034234 [Phytophthora megakarya]
MPESACARLLAAYRGGEDWMLAAAHNDIPPTTARGDWTCIAASTRWSSELLHQVHPRDRGCSGEYLDENRTYTLNAMKDMVRFDFGVGLSTSTISNKLTAKVDTTKQVRVEPMTCNSDVNKAKRMVFIKELRQHMEAGDFIVYYDETNLNVYCKRSQGRAKMGRASHCCVAAVQRRKPSGACAVSTEMGLVNCRLQRGSITLNVNAAFVDEIYDKVKSSTIFHEHFEGKKVVVVLDNAPVHNQTEDLITERDDLNLVLLRLAPYSPICNPIEGKQFLHCFQLRYETNNNGALIQGASAFLKPR